MLLVEFVFFIPGFLGLSRRAFGQAESALVPHEPLGHIDIPMVQALALWTALLIVLVSALAEIGETRRARELCEKLLSYASPLLLYAEEIDPRSGRHLGNFPQAFTHLALINAVMHVIRLEAAQPVGESGAWAGSTPPSA